MDGIVGSWHGNLDFDLICLNLIIYACNLSLGATRTCNINHVIFQKRNVFLLLFKFFISLSRFPFLSACSVGKKQH